MNSSSRIKTTLLALTTSLLASGSLLAQAANDSDTAAKAGGGIGGLFGLALGILIIAGMWKIFTKAGQPGWASIIPIYNTYILCKIVGKPGWWVILFFIPFVNFIVIILLMVELAKCFGKGVGYAIGMLLLGFIFIPMLGFGDATYQGAKALNPGV